MSIQSVSTSPPPQVNAEAVTALREPRAVAVTAGARAEAEQPASPVSKEQLEAAVQSVRAYIEPIHSGLEFSINNETEQVVIKVIDNTTKEVIRQIPSEEMIAMAKALDRIKGLFIKQRA